MDVTKTIQPKIKYKLLYTVLLGCLAMAAQLAFIRLATFSFFGNELTICFVMGHWLLWSGLGGIVGSSLVRHYKSDRFIFFLTLLYAIVLIVFAYLTIIMRNQKTAFSM